MRAPPPERRNAARGRGGASVKSGGTSVASATRHWDLTLLDQYTQRQPEALPLDPDVGPEPEALATIGDRVLRGIWWTARRAGRRLPAYADLIVVDGGAR